MTKTANKERIAFLRSIYDSHRHDPTAQLEIRRDIKRLQGVKP